MAYPKNLGPIISLIADYSIISHTRFSTSLHIPIPMAYVRLYSPEELRGLLDWVSEQKDNFPEQLRLDDAIFIPNLRQTVSNLLEAIDMHAECPAFYGEIEILFRIREKLEQTQG